MVYQTVSRMLSVLTVLGVLTGSSTKGFAADPETRQPDSTTMKQASASPLPDDRFKADILVVIAHPDDETLISGYLAKAALDDGKRVGVVFTTRGNGGGNEVGYEQGAALADIREMEARHGLAAIGITNVWFLDATDTPARDVHNVLRSLETANHGSTLGRVVRLTRLTRPSVVLTFLPCVVAGENHGDHQAAGVIATEAFDMAGDPTRFSEQVSFPDDRTGYANLTEGLRPWQAQKLYYFSDAGHVDFLKGKGPEYPVTGTSGSRHMPYYHLKAIEASYYLTQIGVGENANRAIKSGDFAEFQMPEYLVLGKSLVKGVVTGDILEGTVPGPVPFVAVQGYKAPQHAGISVEPGGPWSFYAEFWQAHDLDHLSDLLPGPELGIGSGRDFPIELLLRNDTDRDAVLTLQSELPPGWTEKRGSARYPVRAHDIYPVRAVVHAAPSKESSWQDIRFSVASGSESNSTRFRVYAGASSQ